MRIKRFLNSILGGDRVEINPDEIFLDSSNLPNFDKDQFEGRIEKPFSRVVPILTLSFFILVTLIFSWKVWGLQIVQGEKLAERSARNSLIKTSIFSERGSILDRNDKILATNVPAKEGGDFSLRRYTDLKGLAHILGYLKYPQKDKNGYYYQTEFTGVDGVEKTYNDYLTGKNGLRIIEVDAGGEIATYSVIDPPINGKNLKLSIDSELQDKLFTEIESLASKAGYSGGAGAIMDIKTGKLIALTSFPEYNSQILTDGTNKEVISSYITDKRNVYLNRAISGLYAPGSVMKIFLAMGVQKEGVIDPNKKIESKGSITVPNPYSPGTGTTFRDWKPLGWVDMRDALSFSSNIYFFHVGGGFDGQKGIGIEKIVNYFRMFGFGNKTGLNLPNEASGVVPDPEWKKQNFDGDSWRLGDTFLTSIGQYGSLATLIQILRGTTAIVNNGNLYTPSLVEDEEPKFEKLDFEEKYYDVVKEGMYRAVYNGGTAHNLSSLPFKIGAKTGTAELGVTKENINSWITGFFPYDNPKYAFAIMMERGLKTNTIGSVYVTNELFLWMNENRPEYVR